MHSSAEPVMPLVWWGSLTDVFSNWSQSAAEATGIQLSVIAATKRLAKRRIDKVLILILLLGCPGIRARNALEACDLSGCQCCQARWSEYWYILLPRSIADACG